MERGVDREGGKEIARECERERKIDEGERIRGREEGGERGREREKER